MPKQVSSVEEYYAEIDSAGEFDKKKGYRWPFKWKIDVITKYTRL